MGARHLIRAFAVAASLAALALAAGAASAAGSVTIGQVADPNAGNCDPGVDLVQLGESSGNRYVVPGTGTITSWTTQAGAAGGALALKVFRRGADPASFRVVGHTDARRLSPGGTTGNTFPANIRVSPGDLLGLHTPSASPCGFKDPGGLNASFSGDLGDGQAARFAPQPDFDLDVRAVFVPDNTFIVGSARRNKRKGTATLTVSLPNAGELSLSGRGVRPRAASAVTAGAETTLQVKPNGKALKTLKRTGKAKVLPSITYVPNGGEPSVRSIALRLKRLKPHRGKTTRR